MEIRLDETALKGTQMRAAQSPDTRFTFAAILRIAKRSPHMDGKGSYLNLLYCRRSH
jgi:hypothetical protein